MQGSPHSRKIQVDEQLNFNSSYESKDYKALSIIIIFNCHAQGTFSPFGHEKLKILTKQTSITCSQNPIPGTSSQSVRHTLCQLQ